MGKTERKREEEKAVECCHFLLDPFFCWPFTGHRSYLPPWQQWCQSSVSRPVEAKEAKETSAVATQNFTWNSKFEQREPSQRASSCSLAVCGLVYSKAHALVAMSSGKLSVSSPVFWPWGQLAFNELHPCYWTLENRVAAAKLTVGAVPLVVPRIWGLLGGELAGLGPVCARTSWAVQQWQQLSAKAWECLGIGHGTSHSTDITRACPPCLSLQQRHESC